MEPQAGFLSVLSSGCNRKLEPCGQDVNEIQRCKLQEQQEVLTKARIRCREQNVVQERKRRRRITVSCEQLRELLPYFSGRRSDVASILEMTVKYLELVQMLLPTEQESIVQQGLALHKDMALFTQDTKRRRKLIPREDSRETTQGQLRKKKAKTVTASTTAANSLSRERQAGKSKAFARRKVPVTKADGQAAHLEGEIPDPGRLTSSHQTWAIEGAGSVCELSEEPDQLGWQDGNASHLTSTVRDTLDYCKTSYNHLEKFDAWSSPTQQSPLLSSTSWRWLDCAQNTRISSYPESLLPPSPAGGLLMAGSMHPATEMIDTIPHLPCATAEQWMDEQEQMHFKPSALELNFHDGAQFLPSADWTESTPGMKDQMAVLGELDPALLSALEQPGDAVEAWEPAAFSPGLDYREEIDAAFADNFSLEPTELEFKTSLCSS